MKPTLPQPLSKRRFQEMAREPALVSIDGDRRVYHLASGYWVYDEMLSALKNSGWIRFAPGFKAGLYGKAGCQHCIKILGMGVGENPLYFCERGYYLEHERRLLERFRSRGFVFGPKALSTEDSIRLLVDQGGVPARQAELRVTRNDVLIMDFISGVPLAIQTGQYVNYDLEIVGFDRELLAEVLAALQQLHRELDQANGLGLLHNDPMPPNIILSLNDAGELTARLVDFELAQDLSEPSPDYVNNSVAELYSERDVPRNSKTGRHTKNLDQHLLDESIRLVRDLLPIAGQVRSLAEALDGYR
jgi:serine/threonine protein kinase